MGCQRLAKAVVIVLAMATAIRLAPTLWTPYPFNPDGFVFAAHARDTSAVGILPPELLSNHPHGYNLPTLFSLVAIITDIAPLWLAQLLIAAIGALPPVLVVLLVWRLADRPTGDSAAVTIAALTAGLTATTNQGRGDAVRWLDRDTVFTWEAMSTIHG